MRNVKECIKNLKKLATVDVNTALSCYYTIISEGKPVTGVSVRFAELVVYCWGNITAGARIIDKSERHIIIEGFAKDNETNNESTVQLLQPIINSNGSLMNDSTRTTKSNATSSIAYRNAVFKIIPSAVLHSAETHITNYIIKNYDVDIEKDVTKFFEEKGISKEELIEKLKLSENYSIDIRQIMFLVGVKNALIEGDSTIEEMFQPKTRKTKFEKAFD